MSDTLGRFISLVVLVVLGILISRSPSTRSRVRNRVLYFGLLIALVVPGLVLLILWSPEPGNPLFIALQLAVVAVWAIPVLRQRWSR